MPAGALEPIPKGSPRNDRPGGADGGAASPSRGPSVGPRLRRGGCSGALAGVWEADRTFLPKDDGSAERRYVLDMFPYPLATCTWVTPRHS